MHIVWHNEKILFFTAQTCIGWLSSPCNIILISRLLVSSRDCCTAEKIDSLWENFARRGVSRVMEGKELKYHLYLQGDWAVGASRKRVSTRARKEVYFSLLLCKLDWNEDLLRSKTKSLLSGTSWNCRKLCDVFSCRLFVFTALYHDAAKVDDARLNQWLFFGSLC